MEREKGKESLPFRNKGQTKERLAARLKRDHPEIASMVMAGEFKSIRATALEAGIVRPVRTVPIDSPDNAIRALARVFPAEQLAIAALALTDTGRAGQ